MSLRPSHAPFTCNWLARMYSRALSPKARSQLVVRRARAPSSLGRRSTSSITTYNSTSSRWSAASGAGSSFPACRPARNLTSSPFHRSSTARARWPALCKVRPAAARATLYPRTPSSAGHPLARPSVRGCDNPVDRPDADAHVDAPLAQRAGLFGQDSTHRPRHRP